MHVHDKLRELHCRQTSQTESCSRNKGKATLADPLGWVGPPILRSPTHYPRGMISPTGYSLPCPCMFNLICNTLKTTISLVHRSSHFPTHLHLRRHSGTRVLSAIQQGLVPLGNPRILLGHIHRHICRDRGQTQGFVAIGDRPHLRRDGAHPGRSIEGTALDREDGVSRVRSPHITLDQSSHTSVAWTSRASSCVIWLCGLRDTSSNLVSKFIWRIDRLCAVAVFLPVSLLAVH